MVRSRKSAYTRHVFDSEASTVTAVDDVRVDFGPADRAVVDATGGTLELAASSLEVVSLPLVGLSCSPVDLANRVGLVAEGGFVHGARWGVLAPVDGQWRVSILTAGETTAAGSRIDVGRLTDRDVERWATTLAGRLVRVVVFIEAAPFASIEARFRRDLLDATAAPAPGPSGPSREDLDLAAPPAPPAQWYVDPADQSKHRYWDGAAWTAHTAAR